MKLNFANNYWSFSVALLLVFYFVSWPFLNYWSNPFMWDTFGYYLYLPMSLIHYDLGISDFSVLEDVKREQFISPTFYQINKTETGNWLIRYPMGLALLHAPFYGVGHLFAKLLGFNSNGFSLPYQIAINAGSLFYLSSSIILLRRILLRWFKDNVVALTLLIIYLGTNLVSQGTVHIVMAHSNLFFIYTLIIYFTYRWHEDKSIFNSIFLGGVIGLAIICRPTEVVSVLIPLFWGVKNLKDLKEKAINIWSNKRMSLLLAVLVSFMVISLQLIYWKVYTGHFVYNSYHNIGEGLDLLTPHVWNVLFNFKKGWVIYTPIMLFSIAGFYYFKKYKADYFLSFFTFFIVNFYLVSSWTCWWYAASFGQRALVQSYVVMAISLAFFIDALLKMPQIKRIIYGCLVFFFFSLNVFQNYQFREGIIHSHRMTFDYYMAVFGRLNVNTGDLEHLLSYDRDLTFEESLKKHEYSKSEILENSFEKGIDKTITTRAKTGSNSLFLNEENPFSKSFSIRYDNITEEDYCWLEIKFWAYFVNNNSNINLVNTIGRSGDNYGYSANNLILDPSKIELNKWKEYTFHYQTPHIRSGSDEFISYFWFCGGEEVYIDDLTITKYTPK